MANLRTDDKRQQYARVFGHFDEDKDGKISSSELCRCVRSIGGDLTLEEAEAAVEMLDRDEDGLLGMEDFVAFVEGGDGEERQKELRMAFEMYGEEGGERRITPRSLKRMLSRLGEKRSVGECEVMISKFDLDGNGVLDFEEFSVMMS
ncbi:hypothetical protein MLD38_000116 [Melastoma candidum]|uniref:Uncharacterized protein n=1 Tax=Melastoma candidum TaxID=119954 RepID=A0ACB9S965_9MYRT|nr:hypothetical protein MLD38_000116 [Melastoma candidum]